MISHPLKSMENSIVATLIDDGTRQLNERLIDGIFSQEKVEIIKKNPIRLVD